jgi:hypothetical protein
LQKAPGDAVRVSDLPHLIYGKIFFCNSDPLIVLKVTKASKFAAASFPSCSSRLLELLKSCSS